MINNEKHYFKLWHCLDLKLSENKRIEQAKNIIDSLDCYCGGYQVDNEGVLKADLMLETIKELIDLSYILNDDIVIYGSDCDILITKKTMKELGLD